MTDAVDIFLKPVCEEYNKNQSEMSLKLILGLVVRLPNKTEPIFDPKFAFQLIHKELHEELKNKILAYSL
jgi:hypothetical protein